MENQHKLIKGYRDLSQTEIDLMNRIKIAEAQVLELTQEVKAHIHQQADAAANSKEEHERMMDASPLRWLSISVTHLEQGFMSLVRAVAQPMSPRLEKDN